MLPQRYETLLHEILQYFFLIFLNNLQRVRQGKYLNNLLLQHIVLLH